MRQAISIYLFRDRHFAPAGDIVVAAAPSDLVVSVYGGGGLKGEGGLAKAFGGAAFFKNDEAGSCFLGVWGKRNASRFQRGLRQAGADFTIENEAPPARLVWFSKTKPRPPERNDG